MLFRNFAATCLVTLFAITTIADSASAEVRVRKVGSNLIVTGDAEDNFLFVEVDRFTGIIYAPTEEIFFVEDIKKIIVRSLGGDDFVSITQFDAVFPELALIDVPLPLINLDVSTAAGDDEVSIVGDWGKTRIITSVGDDDIYLTGSFSEFEDTFTIFEEPAPSSFRDLYISSGGGKDTVNISDIIVGYSHETTSNDGIVSSRVYTGGGNDDVSIINYSTQPGANGRDIRTVLLTGGGDDEVTFYGSLSKRDYLNGGGGKFDCLDLDLYAGSAEPNDVILRGFEEENCNDYIVILQ